MSGSGTGSNSYTAQNLLIPYVAPDNVPAAAKSYINPIYLCFQNLIQTLITYCGISPRNPANVLSSLNDPTAYLASNVHRFYTQASENIPVGAAISLYSSLGQLNVRNANATDNTRPAHGFCSQGGGILAGGVGEVILGDGMNQNVSGLTPGSVYYLSTVNGGYTSIAPGAAGNIAQQLGLAISATALMFRIGSTVQH